MYDEKSLGSFRELWKSVAIQDWTEGLW